MGSVILVQRQIFVMPMHEKGTTHLPLGNNISNAQIQALF